MKKILLVSPSYSFIYEGSMIKPGGIYSPPLGLAAIAGALDSAGHSVRVADLNRIDEKSFVDEITAFGPEYVGIGFNTPLAEEAFRLSRLIKAVGKDIIVVAGGVHPSSMPGEVLKESSIDIVCIGEADFSITEIVAGKPLESIPGIAYRKNGAHRISPGKQFIQDLDRLAYPAWKHFDIKSYKTTRLLTRNNPTGWIETSRGCPYGCIYCNKTVFGRTFRVKSTSRVVDEIQYMLKSGFREIHIADDCFTADINRAKDICREILRRGVVFDWATVTGIRADRVDRELLLLMRRAGCYRVYFGIETGSEDILRIINKGETLEDIRRAVAMSKKAGLETFGFFMLALPGETEKTMQETIDFAKELKLDMAKIAITIPLPATEYYEQLKKQGRIKETKWSKYNLYFPARELFDHPTVDWDVVEAYNRKFYRTFYFDPRFILKRLIKGIRYGHILTDISSFLQIKWWE